MHETAKEIKLKGNRKSPLAPAPAFSPPRTENLTLHLHHHHDISLLLPIQTRFSWQLHQVAPKMFIKPDDTHGGSGLLWQPTCATKWPT